MHRRFDNSHDNEPDFNASDFKAQGGGDGYLVADFSRADTPTSQALSRPFKILFALTLALATWVVLIAGVVAVI